MAPSRARRGRGRGRASQAPANRGSRPRHGGSRRGGSRAEPQAHHPPKSLIVTLRIRAPWPKLEPVQQLATPESTNLSTDSPAPQQDSPAQAAGEGAVVHHPMAPVKDPNNVDDQIKDVIQHLFEVQSAVHGYLPETQGPLVDKITDLTHSLAALRALAASPNSSVAGIELPPEILDYVDGGRNPDVYTREFVELVQRGNAVLNGKQEAFKSFSEVYAQELASAMPETKRQVERVMHNAGLKIRGVELAEGEGEEGKLLREVEGEGDRERQGNGRD